MWQEIDRQISEVTGQKFQTIHKSSVSGGCINQGYAISNGNITYFVKTNQASQGEMFAAEMLSLRQMYETKTIRVPQPLCWGTTDNCSYIVLEWLEMSAGNNKSWQQMGRNLAAMHKTTSEQGFGWHINNTIGSTPQINNWMLSWDEFFFKNRLGYQFHLARRRGGNFPGEQKLLDVIPSLLADHKPEPSLVHGDLWGGNVGFIINGQPVIFDPATYFGDREVDIAMTELFGGFPPSFYQGYEEEFPLAQGYEKRKNIYNLYHILNHFNLFGGGYSNQANGMIGRILESIR
ncbi:fructosamine kinase family protein [Cylindrospermopsis raciborskii CENA303]|uniref:Fructosamine kinase family protein n=1 Tax=Cylindrospermopsis raciborskii CENA303 TaxID=1170769 RepID=A0A1X4G644_9CYAN|nr:fructosamine kinase family protein [Cylindrospermopsis raciborskii]EFA74151.1 Aminoglycoside phosphotransferase [Raphidiopsis brookii D9]OSO90064.1 fructosamine kinase family protein [Cylindrospermopsis raciborskii CENA303]